LLLKRLFSTIFVLLGISLVIVIFLRLAPGDPAQMLLGGMARAEEAARLRESLGLDQPLLVQYWHFIRHAVMFDFGMSYRYQEPALSLFLERLPATIELTIASLAIAVAIGIPVGVASAQRQDSWLDHVGMAFTLAGASIPTFWLGTLLMLVFGSALNLLPVSGRLDAGIELRTVTGLHVLDSLLTLNRPAIADALAHLTMPAVTLGIVLSAIIGRVTRSAMLEVVRQDYVTTARVKGLPERSVIWRHCLRNALPSVVTIIGLQLGGLLAGSIIVETVFAWPGVGSLLIQAVSLRDYQLVQCVVVLLAALYVLVNIGVDLAYVLIDPRTSLR
jgi:peptide/nickel transport system permease protein